MIEKIILAITHSDDYTDYLFQTACLTNSRIIPMLNPSALELHDATGDNTIVYRCYGWQKARQKIAPSVLADSANRTIIVQTEYYLRDDESIDITESEIAREMIERPYWKYWNRLRIFGKCTVDISPDCGMSEKKSMPDRSCSTPVAASVISSLENVCERLL